MQKKWKTHATIYSVSKKIPKCGKLCPENGYFSGKFRIYLILPFFIFPLFPQTFPQKKACYIRKNDEFQGFLKNTARIFPQVIHICTFCLRFFHIFHILFHFFTPKAPALIGGTYYICTFISFSAFGKQSFPHLSALKIRVDTAAILCYNPKGEEWLLWKENTL